jgi:hypothetical protein
MRTNQLMPRNICITLKGPGAEKRLAPRRYNPATPAIPCFPAGLNYHRKPREMSQFGQNPPKYSTAYIVQQSNCRWHCEPTFFLGWTFYNDKSLHTLPLQFLHLLSLPLQSLPLQTLRLIFLVSLIILNIKNTVPECTICGHYI